MFRVIIKRIKTITFFSPKKCHVWAETKDTLKPDLNMKGVNRINQINFHILYTYTDGILNLRPREQ